ncbi:MAG TPA: hypothetical protein VM366_04510 [Anaerolineae bacterium]|nr:hypothetical protein [Anaerolineae bacterium]
MAKDTPKYSGIRFYRDPGGRFQLRYPTGWHPYELADQRDGVMFSPQGEDPRTWFAIWSTRLEHAVVADDIDLLREGVEEGLLQLPGLHVESSSDDPFDNLIRFERIYTFEEDGVVRKRRVWMTYVWKWLFTLVAQGETVEEFHYWRMMLNDFFDAFDLAPELWFASDRELAQDVS